MFPRPWALRAVRASRRWDHRAPCAGNPPESSMETPVPRSRLAVPGSPRGSPCPHTPRKPRRGTQEFSPLCLRAPCLLRSLPNPGVLSGPGAWGAGAGLVLLGPCAPLCRRQGPGWPEAPRGTGRAVQRSQLPGLPGCRRRSVPGAAARRKRVEAVSLHFSARSGVPPGHCPGAPAPSGISDQLRLGSA